jgi:5-methylcytosine-specific restriction endonuclease McrA
MTNVIMSVPHECPDTPLFHKLWNTQSGACALCGKAMPRHRFEVAHATLWKKWRPSFDHILPRGAGGGDGENNLQLAHLLCNKRKGRSISS